MKYKELQTPCYIVQEKRLRENLEILRQVCQETGCRILLAQKAFSMFSVYPLIRKYLNGTAASGLYEARLGAEEMGKENHIFSPAYREDEMEEILRFCDHIILNSPGQIRRFKDRILEAGKSPGIRINPECSTQEGHAIYDPCAPFSRMGLRAELLTEELMEGIQGIHFHTLCEQNSDDLETTLQAVEEKFGNWLPRMKWVNFGGGHHITREDYDIERLKSCIRHIQEKYQVTVYLEPGEAIALNAGILLTTVLERMENGMDIAILDTSAAGCAGDALSPAAERWRKTGRKNVYLPPGRTHLPGWRRNRGLFLRQSSASRGQAGISGYGNLYDGKKQYLQWNEASGSGLGKRGR